MGEPPNTDDVWRAPGRNERVLVDLVTSEWVFARTVDASGGLVSAQKLSHDSWFRLCKAHRLAKEVSRG